LKQTFFACFLAFVAACAPAGTGTDANSTTSNDTASTTATAESSAETTSAAPPAAVKEKPMSYYENKVAEIHTTAGDIHIRFYPDVAPNHVKNFIELAESGFYNGIKFHRVIPGFMIQGGDPNTIKGDPYTWGTGGSEKKLKAEFSTVSHKRGIVSAARTNDPNSASSQFFIMVGDAPQLDRNYSVFGAVTKGMDVADKIVSAPTGANDRPNDPVSITKITFREARPDEQGPAPK